MTSTLDNLTVQVASGDALDVRRFAVEQRMSSLFEVTLTAYSSDADLDFDAVVGQPASFQVHAGARGESPIQLWTGLCKHMQQVAMEEAGVSTYEITIVPTLWLTTQRRNHRMFQQLSELDIVLQILGEWGIEPELRIAGTYKKREYRVQYAESDYAFVCRMLEDAGISFFFEQADTASRLVLTDAPQAAAPRAPIPFRDNPMNARDREHVTGLRVAQRVRPGRYTLRDHDTRLPAGYPLLAGAEAPASGIEGRLERFHYTPGAFLFGTDQGDDQPHGDDRGKSRSDEREGRTLAKKRLDAKRSSKRTCSFETNAADLAPGVVLTILDHPRSDLAEKPLLVVASSLSGDSHGDWTHRCEARRADVAYRPPLSTRKPKVSGVESATVVGPPGEEIHTDELGRVRVHFHWDRESRMNHQSSCWIHVSQPWGGSGYGGSNLPRVGQEVLVDFLGGDPDRPIITGRVYTSLQTTPYKLPDNKTQSGWKSSSSPATGGYNEIMFEDAAGRELVRMQAEKDLHKLVKNDENVTIGNNRTKLVQNDDAFTVGNNRTKVVQVDENVTIGNNRTKAVQNDESVTIGNNHTRSVQNDEHVTIGNDHKRSVQNDEHVTIGNDHKRSVQNDEHVTVGNDHTRQVKSNEAVTIGKDLMHSVLANARELTGLMRNVVVGVNRSTQVGLVDSTSVGQMYSVKVSPPGELLPGLETSIVANINSIVLTTAGGATTTMNDKTIVLNTGATVTLKEKAISLDADADAEKSATMDLNDKGIVLDMNGTATITIADKKIELAVGDNKIAITDKGIVIVGKTVDVTGKPINLNC